MQSIQTFSSFSVAQTKPLEAVRKYRRFCVAEVEKLLQKGGGRRSVSPVTGEPLEPWENVDGIEYGICSQTGSLFMVAMPDKEEWSALLKKTADYRMTQIFQKEVTQARSENVLQPKMEWISNTVRIHGLRKPTLTEVSTPSSPLLPLLQSQTLFGSVESAEEEGTFPESDIVLLPETLDRVLHPKQLLEKAVRALRPGGVLMLTSLVASGFDFTLLGKENVYFYPPDRANCFSLQGLKRLVENSGLSLSEASTPGVLDVQIVKAHQKEGLSLPLSSFDRDLLEGDEETLSVFQGFLQQSGRSSFARIVAKKPNT